jgi:hypothetical protein
MQVAALRAEAEHRHLSLGADHGQRAHGAFGMLTRIEFVGDLRRVLAASQQSSRLNSSNLTVIQATMNLLIYKLRASMV